jgi:hypothetical protein
MDELDSKLRNLEELEAARAKEAWEKHVVSTQRHLAYEKNIKMITFLFNHFKFSNALACFKLCKLNYPFFVVKYFFPLQNY